MFVSETKRWTDSGVVIFAKNTYCCNKNSDRRARAREKSWLKPNSWDFSKWMWRENNQVIPVIRNKLLEIVDIVINRLNDLFNMRHWIGHSSYFTHFNVWIWFVSALFVMQFDFLSSSFFFVDLIDNTVHHVNSIQCLCEAFARKIYMDLFAVVEMEDKELVIEYECVIKDLSWPKRISYI